MGAHARIAEHLPLHSRTDPPCSHRRRVALEGTSSPYTAMSTSSQGAVLDRMDTTSHPSPGSQGDEPPLLGPCAALQQVQVLLEVAIQHHYDIMPARHFEHRFRRLHGPSQETKLKLQLLLASLRSKCAATPEEAAGAA